MSETRAPALQPYVRVIERETWGHIGVFDVQRVADAVIVKTFYTFEEAAEFARALNAVAALFPSRAPEPEVAR